MPAWFVLAVLTEPLQSKPLHDRSTKDLNLTQPPGIPAVHPHVCPITVLFRNGPGKSHFLSPVRLRPSWQPATPSTEPVKIWARSPREDPVMTLRNLAPLRAFDTKRSTQRDFVHHMYSFLFRAMEESTPP